MPKTEEERQQKPREEDGRILKVVGLPDFMYREIYGEPDQYSPRERQVQYVNLAVYEIMAEAGILKIEDLKTILQVAYRIARPNDLHPLTYSTLDSFVKD